MTNWMRDPRNSGNRSFGPAFGGPRRSAPNRRSSGLRELIQERRGIVIIAVIVIFFIIAAVGASNRPDSEEGQQSLLSEVQSAMVQAGLPTVEVRVIDWNVILEGQVPSSDLKEAAGRVAQAQSGVVNVDNRLVVPASAIIEIETETVPELPAALSDLLLQARLSEAAARAPIEFESGGDRITEDSATTLDQIASFLSTNVTVRVQIVGHTDSDGDEVANLNLSTLRAEAVRSQLVARGIDPERLLTLGYGEYDPVADNITQEGKKRNRRIEFLVLPEGNNGIEPPTTTTEPPATTTEAPATTTEAPSSTTESSVTSTTESE
ncbi:MAG TPA: OmpA family protein [Acidimicrobiales bacterium]|nr:OmpA family protein [Acidimicrobiales bacterium]